MKNKLHYSPEAIKDLDEIWDYIANELVNPDASKNVVNNILNIIEKLEDYSELGALLSSVTDIETNYRFLLAGNYMIFYRPEGTNIYIDRILYSRRDYLHILFPDLPEENAQQ